MQAELIKAERDGNSLKLTALVYDAPAVLDRVAKLAGKEVNITVSEPKEKRSLDQNSFAWYLIGKIADKLRASKNEIYLRLLRDYGQSIIVTVKRGLDLSKAGFKYYDEIRTGEINGKPFTAYKVYIGSSQYDKKQMTVLLDGIISECKELGIETDLEEYIALMDN